MLVRILGQLLNAGILVDKSLEARTVSPGQAAPISKQPDETCRQASCSWKLSESPRRLLEVVPRWQALWRRRARRWLAVEG